MHRITKLLPLPLIDQEVDVVILADGGYPSGAMAKSFLDRAQRVICCDGAAISFEANGGEPYAIVGDCDSLTDEFRKRYRERIYCDKDQENNDLTKAVKYCIAHGMTNLTILGATGRRDDHSIGNIGLLAEYVQFERLESVRIISDCGVFDPFIGDMSFESAQGQQVSIFTPIPDTHITTHNLKYPLTRAYFGGWWQGTLNQSLGTSFGIETNGVAIIYRVL